MPKYFWSWKIGEIKPRTSYESHRNEEEETLVGPFDSVEDCIKDASSLFDEFYNRDDDPDDDEIYYETVFLYSAEPYVPVSLIDILNEDEDYILKTLEEHNINCDRVLNQDLNSDVYGSVEVDWDVYGDMMRHLKTSIRVFCNTNNPFKEFFEVDLIGEREAKAELNKISKKYEISFI